MKFLLLTFVLLLTRCECRIASAEADIEGETEDKVKTPNFSCTYRSLIAGDPYPSVVVRWKGQIQRFSWNKAGDVVFEKNYQPPTMSVSYPPSGGLSGGSSSANADYFKDVPVVPDEYSFEDIKTWFDDECVKPTY